MRQDEEVHLGTAAGTDHSYGGASSAKINANNVNDTGTEWAARCQATSP